MPFHVTGFSTLPAQVTPVAPSSYPGPTDVATILANLAQTMGLQFENSGVSGVMLSDPYLAGTAYYQMQEAAEAAGINAVIDNGTLAIWPRGQGRNLPAVTISPQTGMIGYPASLDNGNGIIVSTLFNNSITFGAPVQIQNSGIKQANGLWWVYGIEHELQSQTPGGQWRTKMQAWTNTLGPIPA